MQSYGDFLPIPRKISDSSPTCMDKNGIFGQIVETGPKTVRTGLRLTDVELVFSSFANLLEKKLYICKRETYKEE